MLAAVGMVRSAKNLVGVAAGWRAPALRPPVRRSQPWVGSKEGEGAFPAPRLPMELFSAEEEGGERIVLRRVIQSMVAEAAAGSAAQVVLQCMGARVEVHPVASLRALDSSPEAAAPVRPGSLTQAQEPQASSSSRRFNSGLKLDGRDGK